MTQSRRWDRQPETPRDTRFLDLRDSGYTGPIDQDGYAVTEGEDADALHRMKSGGSTVALVCKQGSYGYDLRSADGATTLFTLTATTSGEPGVYMQSALPGLHTQVYKHPDKHGQGMKAAQAACVYAYQKWILDKLGLAVLVQLVDESRAVLMCSNCNAAHPPQIVLDAETGDMLRGW